MWTATGGIIGVGYEGHDIDSFLKHLQPWKIDIVIDVRLTAISRKRGFSKKALSLALSNAGIGYEHFRSLGNPKDNRDGFWMPGSRAADIAHERYRSLLAEDEGSGAIREIVELAQSNRVALLCFESSQLSCHRRIVIEAVEQELHSLTHAQ